jgi:thiopurine S-methyltransferase
MQEDWAARWREGRTSFHEGRPNDLLVRAAARLDGCRRVLVPLCGKAEDLAFLAARGHDVVGIELVEPAVQAFFAEHDLAPSVARHGPYTAYRVDRVAPGGGAITLLVGDFFALTPELLGPADGLYDRAALIALPPELRPRYAVLLRALLPAGAPALVITVEYDQAALTGPPFAVLESELRALYEGASVEFLEQRIYTIGKCAQLEDPAMERGFALRL